MKELSVYDVLKILLKDKESCTVGDMSRFRDDYCKKHPYTYINITRDELGYVSPKSFYFDHINNVFYKQKHVKCPICGDTHYKYPETKKFKKIVKNLKMLKIYDKITEKSKNHE